MKKICSLIMLSAFLFSLAACGSGTNHEEASSASQQAKTSDLEATKEAGQPKDSSGTDQTRPKSLVVYFSWSGNTENAARSVQSQTDSDLFEIVPAESYGEDYDTLLEAAREEQANSARPAIAGSVEDMEQYDVVYVGFPIWWGDMPMILYTFFDTYDLSGKTVALFCTSGGSGLSNTVNEVKDLEPDAIVTEGLHISSDASSDPDNAVREWLNAIGLAEQEEIS